jgi:hypothetical protein
MAGDHRLVVSLIGPVEAFAAGIENLNQWCESTKLTLLGSHSSTTSA